MWCQAMRWELSSRSGTIEFFMTVDLIFHPAFCMVTKFECQQTFSSCHSVWECQSERWRWPRRHHHLVIAPMKMSNQKKEDLSRKCQFENRRSQRITPAIRKPADKNEWRCPIKSFSFQGGLRMFCSARMSSPKRWHLLGHTYRLECQCTYTHYPQEKRKLFPEVSSSSII